MKLSNISYIEHWKKPKQQLKKEVEDIADQISDLLDNKAIILPEAIKIAIRKEQENIISASYDTVGTLFTKLFYSHNTTLKSLTELHGNIESIQNLIPLLVKISETIEPLNQSLDNVIDSFEQQTGINVKQLMLSPVPTNYNQYPHFQYWRNLSNLNYLINITENISYIERINQFTDLVRSKIIKLANDTNTYYSSNDTTEDIVNHIVKSIQTNTIRRQHLIANSHKLPSNQRY